MPKDEADTLQKRIAEGLEPDMELMDGIIDKKIGEEIARASGYDEDEIRAGEDGRSAWEENARQMVEQLE